MFIILKFSVIIPCFNQAHFLNDSLSSLIQQSFQYWEAVIVNDGSTDNTVEIANEWCKRDSRIKLISTSNHGLSAARNIGIKFSAGKFIALLDADDKYAPTHLDSMLEEFKKDVDIVFGGYTYFSNDKDNLHVVTLDKKLNFDQILHKNMVPPVSVSFKSSALEFCGLFDTTLKSAEDWDLWIRFFKSGAQLGIIQKSTTFYRISENSMSRQFSTMYQELKKVAIRATEKDFRISPDFALNIDIKGTNHSSIKKSLLMCLGVAVCQNRISEAIDLFKKEKKLYNFDFLVSDFKLMCSYLSFRYHVSRNDIKYAFEVLYPRFTQFLAELDFSDSDQKAILSELFSVHTKLQIRYKWGFLSPVINRFK
jgi:glycosyltransferase involved in cell wall biosynthesis